MENPECGIALIDEQIKEPLKLLQAWKDEAENCGHLSPNAFCFSTSTRDGKVGARSLILRKLDEDGLAIITDNRSPKVSEIKENPLCSATFLWTYMKGDLLINRQARLECTAEELSREDCQDIYDREPLYCKIRSHICHQGIEVSWEDLDTNYNKLRSEFEEGRNELRMPDHLIGYRLIPHKADFYLSKSNQIADRRCYLKDSTSGQWKYFRVAA